MRNVHKSYCKKNSSHVTWFNIVHRNSLNYNICCAILKTKRHFLCNKCRHEMHNTYICLMWYQTFSLSENQIVIYHLPYMHNAHDNMHNIHLVFKGSFQMETDAHWWLINLTPFSDKPSHPLFAIITSLEDSFQYKGNLRSYFEQM